jgi:hypothetical protein
VLTVLTRPLELTTALVVFELDHVMTRPVSTLLLASRAVAESCAVVPSGRLADVGETDTDATETGGGGAGALTMIVATALLPSLVTVIWVVPALTAVTRPSKLTDAIPASALDDVTTRPVSALPFASLAVTRS